MPSNGSREQILERIREAMAVAAPMRPSVHPGSMFTPITNLLERFQSECAANLMELMLTEDSAASAAAIQQVLNSLPPGNLYVQDAPELRAVTAACQDGRSIVWSSEGPAPEAVQASITLCEALVALTGSVATSSACGGRTGSIVPPCHIVLAHVEQLVPDLESALARLEEAASRSSYAGLITGSSRTADIEKLLVLGAHGPRRLVVVLQRR
ncbi:MAG: lactate utilization protein C [Terriglobales bacterium]